MTDFNRRFQDVLVDNNSGCHLSEAVIYGRFIRYKRMDDILRAYMPDITREVNVFVDLTTMLNKVYKFDNIANPLGILACMGNLPLHYRHYFNRLGIKSNIFLIYSSNDSANNYRYIANYDAKHKIAKDTNPTVHEIIKHNIELLATLVQFMPGIYLKKGTVEPTVIACDLIEKFNQSNVTHNIFITSSDYAYQLPAMSNVLMIYKKSVSTEDGKSEDLSFGVTRENALSIYIQMKTKNPQITNIDETWVSPFMTLNGLSCRDIKAIISYTSCLKVLRTIAASYSVITPDSLYNIMESLYPGKGTREEVYARHCAINLRHQLNLYRQLPESLESNFLTDVYDQQALYDISNLYFNGVNTIDFHKL